MEKELLRRRFIMIRLESPAAETSRSCLNCCRPARVMPTKRSTASPAPLDATVLFRPGGVDRASSRASHSFHYQIDQIMRSNRPAQGFRHKLRRRGNITCFPRRAFLLDVTFGGSKRRSAADQSAAYQQTLRASSIRDRVFLIVPYLCKRDASL